MKFEYTNKDSLTLFSDLRDFPSFAILNFEIWMLKHRLTHSFFRFMGYSKFWYIVYSNLNIHLKTHSLFFSDFRDFLCLAWLNIEIWIYKFRLTHSFLWFQGFTKFCNIEFWNLNVEIKTHSLFFPILGIFQVLKYWIFKSEYTNSDSLTLFSDFRDFLCLAWLNIEIWIYK